MREIRKIKEMAIEINMRRKSHSGLIQSGEAGRREECDK